MAFGNLCWWKLNLSFNICLHKTFSVTCIFLCAFLLYLHHPFSFCYSSRSLYIILLLFNWDFCLFPLTQQATRVNFPQQLYRRRELKPSNRIYKYRFIHQKYEHDKTPSLKGNGRKYYILTHTHILSIKKHTKTLFLSALDCFMFISFTIIWYYQWNETETKSLKELSIYFFIMLPKKEKEKTHNNQSFCHKLAPLPTSHFLLLPPSHGY